MTVYFVITSLIKDIIYRSFLSSEVSVASVILLSIYSIKILVLTVPFLNESGCAVLRVITYVSIDMFASLVMNSSLFLVDLTSSIFTSTLVSPSLTSCCSESSFSSVLLSLKSSSDSFSEKKDSFKILDSSSLESFSLLSMILSR